jgi:hypothetical protein
MTTAATSDCYKSCKFTLKFVIDVSWGRFALDRITLCSVPRTLRERDDITVVMKEVKNCQGTNRVYIHKKYF